MKKHEAKEKVEEFVEEKFQVKKVVERIKIKERERVECIWRVGRYNKK
jgi:hypothetical protein